MLCFAGLLIGGSGAAVADELAAQAAVRDFNAAAALQNVGLYDRAAEKWTVFLAQYAGDVRLDRAHYYLGICQLHAKKYAEAINTFQTLLAKYPAFSNAEGAHYNLAMARYQAAADSKRREDFQAAAEALRTLAAKYPQGKYAAAALYYRGESLSAAGDARQAIEAYQKVVNDFPASSIAADAYYALGTSQQEQGRDADAVVTFQKFLDTPALAGHDFAAEVRLRLALSLLKQKKYAEAEPHFAAVAAIAAFPHADLAMLRQGECRLQAGKPAEAAALLAELPKKFPNSAYRSAAQLAAGKGYFAAGKLSDAQQLLDALAKGHDRESAEAAGWLARALVKAGRPQEALAAIEHALASGPSAETASYLELARAEALWDIPDRRREAALFFEKFAAAHPDHPSAAQSLFLAASAALENKDYAAARRCAETLLGNSRLSQPQWMPGMLLIAAESHLAPAGGDPLKAETCYRQLIDRFPKSSEAAQAYYKLGEIALGQKKYDDAIVHYKQCLQQFPQGDFAARSQYGLAAASFAKGDQPGALLALEKLLTASPAAALAARARYLRGLVLQRQSQLESAAKEFEAFLNGNPSPEEAAEARYALALCRIALKQFDQATATLSALLQQKADYAQADWAYYELAQALLREDRTDAAAAALRTLTEKLPRSSLAAEGWFQVGRRYEAAADRAATAEQRTAAAAHAAEAYGAGLAKTPPADLQEKLRYKLADMQFRLKQFEQAAATLQAQLREQPGGSLAGPARFLAAECLFRQDKFAEALPLFVRVVDDKVEKYHALALYRAGTCAANEKKWPESQKFFDTLTREFPAFEQFHDARYGLALALQNQGRLGDARTIDEQVAKATDTETAAKARFMLGEIAFAERKYEDAIEQFVMVTSGYSYKHWQALAQFEIGRCFLSLGKRQQAIDAFQTVVNKYPDHAKAADAARMLAELK
jgi:TolA-binding protein